VWKWPPITEVKNAWRFVAVPLQFKSLCLSTGKTLGLCLMLVRGPVLSVISSHYSCHLVLFGQQYLAERNSPTDHCFGRNGITCRGALHHITSAGEKCGSPRLQCDR
jgi:hypothetical protein